MLQKLVYFLFGFHFHILAKWLKKLFNSSGNKNWIKAISDDPSRHPIHHLLCHIHRPRLRRPDPSLHPNLGLLHRGQKRMGRPQDEAPVQPRRRPRRRRRWRGTTVNASFRSWNEEQLWLSFWVVWAVLKSVTLWMWVRIPAWREFLMKLAVLSWPNLS